MKLVNKKAVEHNLAFALKDAYMKKDVEKLHSAADQIFWADYEIEDMKIAPALLTLIKHALVETGWYPTPKPKAASDEWHPL